MQASSFLICIFTCASAVGAASQRRHCGWHEEGHVSFLQHSVSTKKIEVNSTSAQDAPLGAIGNLSLRHASVNANASQPKDVLVKKSLGAVSSHERRKKSSRGHLEALQAADLRLNNTAGGSSLVIQAVADVVAKAYAGHTGPTHPLLEEWMNRDMWQQVHHGFPEVVAPPTRSTGPAGADIWNTSVAWVNVTLRHPDGVISNLGSKKVEWADVGYLSLESLYIVSLVAYPAVLVFFALVFAVLVGLFTARQASPGHPDAGASPAGSAQDPSALSKLSTSDLPAHVRPWFAWWFLFCRTIPAWMVFGTPSVLVALSYPYPQEVFLLMVVVSSVMVFTNGLYMVFFCPFVLARMQEAMSGQDLKLSLLEPDLRAEEAEVVHWVVLPNYEEDVEVLAGSLESIAESVMARKQICVLLAMEEREHEAQAKASVLKARFTGRFRQVVATYHPPDLPNDPPGKASNMAWAFRWLDGHVMEDASRVLLTVADADSDFHCLYFQGLTRQFVETEPHRRGLTLFQSPIFHVKNYHRQPMPLIVGTMFTSMAEIAVLSDPNAIRFPYSTYSLSLQLARHVGGWDAEWIAEDWHMGIKCFLLTLGKSEVRPVLLPTVNYMPEENSWFGTLRARWSQAKRHALGFSDMSYYFMMLPLLYCRLSALSGKEGGPSLQDFWRTFFMGIAYIVRLVNTHVVVGIMTLYMIISFFLKNLMYFALQDFRHIGQFFDRSTAACGVFFGASLISIAMTTISFQVVYGNLKDRMEPAPAAWQRLFSYRFVHWAYTFGACILFAAVYCSGLATAVWIAAIKVLLSASFEYEVAAKPTKDAHL